MRLFFALIGLLAMLDVVYCKAFAEETYELRFMENLADEESPKELWLVKTVDGGKIIKIESGARLEIGQKIWSPDKKALAIQLWRGSKISSLHLLKRDVNGIFELIELNELNFINAALSRLKGFPKDELDRMSKYHHILGWDGDILKVALVFTSGDKKDGNILIKGHVNVAKNAGMEMDSVQGNVSDKDIEKYSE